MTHASLFTGIGVFDKAAQDIGWELIFQCEIDNFCSNILNQNFPGVKNLGDINNAKTKSYNNTIDIISGGFPCQDISISGLGEGIFGKRSGLWSQFARIIEETNPKYVVIENSPQLLKRGFEKVLHDLSEIGYDAEWECLSASEFGFDHKRERLFIIAYPNAQRRRGILHGIKRSRKEANKKETTLDTQCNPFLRFEQRYSKPAVFGMDDGSATRLDVIKRLGAIGNAVVYDIAYQIFNIINEFEKKEFLISKI